MKLALRALGALAVGAACLTGTALAQKPGYTPPKTSWGAPDIQGDWTNASLTNMQRAPDTPDLVLNEEQVRKIEKLDYYNNRFDEEAKASDTADKRLLDGTDLLQGSGYNVFWIDPGSRVAVVKGEPRASWITEPANGRIPYKNAGGGGRGGALTTGAAIQGEKRIIGAGDSKVAPGKMAYAGPQGFSSNAPPVDGGGGSYGSYDGPETRTIADRCLIGFGTAGGPVMSNVMYNNNYQIVQTPTHAMILVEMVHDARVIPTFASAEEARKHFRPSNMPQWLGDSVGWYEGNKLVVETRNVVQQQRGYLSPAGVLTERFSRWDANDMLYEFEVSDDTRYSQVWKGEQVMRPARSSLYEYACHEGNYAMEGILAGARKLEREGRIVEANASDEGGR